MINKILEIENAQEEVKDPMKDNFSGIGVYKSKKVSRSTLSVFPGQKSIIKSILHGKVQDKLTSCSKEDRTAIWTKDCDSVMFKTPKINKDRSKTVFF